MAIVRRPLPFVLLLVGVALISLGLARALGITPYGVPISLAAIGALLLTGYLGGAVATHVRVSNPLFSHVLFPTYVAALIWGGLILRDARLRVLLPIRRAS